MDIVINFKKYYTNGKINSPNALVLPLSYVKFIRKELHNQNNSKQISEECFVFSDSDNKEYSIQFCNNVAIIAPNNCIE